MGWLALWKGKAQEQEQQVFKYSKKICEFGAASAIKPL